MRRRCAAALLCAFALMLAAADGDAQVSFEVVRGASPHAEQERAFTKGTGRIRGRVTLAETGAVVRRALVRISGVDAGSMTAITDTQGRYELRDLPAALVMPQPTIPTPRTRPRRSASP